MGARRTPRPDRDPVSETTARKLDDFATIARIYLQAAFSVVARKDWPHRTILIFDLHAGPGVWELPDGVRREGSPLILLRLAEQFAAAYGIDYELVAFEERSDRVEQLRRHIAFRGPSRGIVRVVDGDHRTTAPAIVAGMRGGLRGPAYGLAYADPVGRFDPAPMATLFDGLGANYVDGLVHVGATAYKRANGRYAATHGRRDLDGDLRGPGKAHVLLRALGRGQWGWTFAILTGWKLPPKLRDFYELGTAAGEDVCARLLLTEAEWQERYQLAMPLDPPTNGHTAPTPSTSDTPDSWPSAPRSSAAPTDAANGAEPDRHATPTTSSTRPGEDSTCPRT